MRMDFVPQQPKKWDRIWFSAQLTATKVNPCRLESWTALYKNKIITDEYRLNGEDPEKIYLNGISEK